MHKILSLCLAVLLFATNAEAAYNTPTAAGGTNSQYQYNNNGTLGGTTTIPQTGGGTGTGVPGAIVSTLNNASASVLPHWRAALARVVNQTGNATLQFEADSTMCGYNSGTANNMLSSPPAKLAAMFNAAGINTNIETRIGVANSTSDSRYSVGGWSSGSPYSIGGNSNLFATGSVAPITFTPSTNTDTFNIYYYSNALAGTFAYSIDGGAATNVNVGTTRGLFTTTVTGLSLGSHTISISWVSGVPGIAGLRAYDSSRKWLFIVNGCAPGTSTANWNTSTGSNNGPASTSYLSPDAVVIDLGINDWCQGATVASYTTNIQALTTAVKTGSDVIYVSPIPSNPGSACSVGTAPSNAVQQTYVAALSSLASTNNSLLIDTFGHFGSYAAESGFGYYNADGIHPLPIAIADQSAQLFGQMNYGAQILNYLPSYNIPSSATPALLPTNGANQTITLSTNTVPTISGITSGQRITFQICQPATGGPFTWTWPAAVHGGMTVGTTANTCSIQSFDSYSGTTLIAESVGIANIAP